MATAASYSTCKSMVVAELQASAASSSYPTTPDGSVRQYASATEINDKILYADAEICQVIINTAQHPFQTTFVQTSSVIPGPSGNLPARNGMVLRVQVQPGIATTTFASTDISTTTDKVTITNHGLITGQPVVLTASVTLPTGLSLATTYYIIRNSSSTYQFATTLWNALAGTQIDITGVGSGTNTVTTQYVDGTEADSKDSVVQASQYPNLFTTSASGAANYWFIEGNEVYCSGPNCKVVYTDFTLSTSPQAPEPYTSGIVAGAVSHILKDGGDAELSAYYGRIYSEMLGQIAGMAMILPAISQYKK